MVESFTSLCAIALVLAVVDGKPTTTSLDIARHFGKRHDNVMQLIRSLLAQLPAESLLNFKEASHEVPGPNGGMASHPMYRLTRDGFTLLAMGFTGKKALQFKLVYIDAFNKMEAELTGQASQLQHKPKAMLANTAPESEPVFRVTAKELDALVQQRLSQLMTVQPPQQALDIEAHLRDTAEFVVQLATGLNDAANRMKVQRGSVGAALWTNPPFNPQCLING